MRSPNTTRPMPDEFEDWFVEHPDQQKADYEEVWTLSGQADAPFELQEWRVEAMRSSVESELQRESSALRLLPRIRWIWLAAAAVVVGAIAVWMLVPVTYVAHPGTTLTVNLKDGSEIRLNAASTLSHKRTFGWLGRSVELEGEGFFDIASGKTGFSIATFNSRVEVLGTRFNVRARVSDPYPETAVWVEDGVVALSARSDPDEVIRLRAGESASVSSSGVRSLERGSAAGQEAPAWLSGGMSYTDSSLRIVLDEIERRFGTSIAVMPDSLSDERISIHLSRVEDVGTVLEVIAATYGADLESTPDGYRLITK